MSVPAERLQKLSLDDGMPPRTRNVTSQNGRNYDLGALTPSQADAARDGLQSPRMLLYPVLSKAVFPEEGYVGFSVAEKHEVRIPVASDPEDDRSPKHTKCTCATFAREKICSHITWLYDSAQQVFKSPAGRQAPEQLTESGIQQRFTQLAERFSTVEPRPVTEAINRQVNPSQSKEEIEQNVLDTLAVFERGTGSDDGSSRKKPKREGDSPEGLKSNVPEMRTCLDLNQQEFFAQTLSPTVNITDVIVPGDLAESMKGLARHSRLFRDVLNHIIDPRYKASDFVDRLRHDFDEWYFEWKKYRNDNRRTVPPAHVQQFASKVRSIIGSLRSYDNGPRVVPDSYYEDAIDLAVSILGKLCAAPLEYRSSNFSHREEGSRPAIYGSVEATNIDIFKDHTRQPKTLQPSPTEARARNLFVNLLVDPPEGCTKLIEDVARLLDQWSVHLTEDHFEGISTVGKTMQEEMQRDSTIGRERAQQGVLPLLQVLRAHATQRS